MSKSRTIPISGWLRPDTTAAEIDVWPMNWRATEHAEMAGRMTIGLSTGVANLHIRPTRAEALALISALQWAIESAEVEQ